MLSGKRAFEGNTASDLLAAVLKTEPNWNAIPADLDPRVLDLLKRCLEKDVRRRWRDIGDVSVEIERIQTAPFQPASITLATPVARSRWWPVLVAVAAAAVAGIGTWVLKPALSLPIVRSQVVLPADQRFPAWNGRQGIAISPDGTMLVYSAGNQLYMRKLSESEGRPIPGTETAISPFFSPDGQWIGFYSTVESAIKKVPTAGGPPLQIAKTNGIFGTSWTRDLIVFSDGVSIQSVSADGGEPKELARVESSQRAFGPQILGQDKAVLFSLLDIAKGVADWNQADIVVQPLPSGERKLLVRGGTDGRVVPSGHLVYETAGSLWAMPFGLGTLSVRGKAAPVVEGVVQPGTGPAASGLSGACLLYTSDAADERSSVDLG